MHGDSELKKEEMRGSDMGLDQYVYRMSKLDAESVARIEGTDRNVLPENIFCVRKSIVDERPDLYSDLKDILTEVRMKDTLFDEDAWRAKNNIPKDWGVVSVCYSNKHLHIAYGNGTDREPTVVTPDDYVRFSVDEVALYLVAECTEVMYWRKDYDLAAGMAQYYGRQIEDCGYYMMNDEMIALANSHGTDLEAECEHGSCFYHEWY